MDEKSVKNILVSKEASIKEAIKVIDRGSLGIAFVVDKNQKLFGTVTDGDIRRAVLKGISAQKPVKLIANKKPVKISDIATRKEEILRIIERKKIIKKIMPIEGSLKVPVVNGSGKVKDVVFIYADEIGNKIISDKKSDLINHAVKKVAVIGGAGYLGSILCQRLLGAGYKVKVLDNLAYGDRGVKPLIKSRNFKFIKGDIRNVSDIVEGIKGVDAAIHLAAVVGDPMCKKDPEETLEINYLATKNIVEACKLFQVNRFIFSSTCSVYGKNSSSNQKITENSSLNPLSLYAETKMKCEKAIMDSMDENFSPVILRMATLYGYSPNMRFDLAANLLTAKAFFENKIPIFGGSQWRPWLHLHDASDAYIRCLEKPIKEIRGKIFNVASENYKLIDVGKQIQKAVPDSIINISGNAGDKRNYYVSFDRVMSHLNFRPQKKLADGIKEIKEVLLEKKITDYKDSKFRYLES